MRAASSASCDASERSQARDWIARAPLVDFGFAAVERGVITGRVRTDAISDALEKRRAEPGAGALRSALERDVQRAQSLPSTRSAGSA